jgi:hypothetical protein
MYFLGSRSTGIFHVFSWVCYLLEVEFYIKISIIINIVTIFWMKFFQISLKILLLVSCSYRILGNQAPNCHSNIGTTMRVLTSEKGSPASRGLPTYLSCDVILIWCKQTQGLQSEVKENAFICYCCWCYLEIKFLPQMKHNAISFAGQSKKDGSDKEADYCLTWAGCKSRKMLSHI